MTAFKYIGDPAHGGEGPDVVMAHGFAFPKGEAVEVMGEGAIEKLEGNSHFEKIDGRSAEAKAVKAKKRGDEG